MDAVVYVLLGIVFYTLGDKIFPDTEAVRDEVVENTTRKTKLNPDFYHDEEAFMAMASSLKELIKTK